LTFFFPPAFPKERMSLIGLRSRDLPLFSQQLYLWRRLLGPILSGPSLLSDVWWAYWFGKFRHFLAFGGSFFAYFPSPEPAQEFYLPSFDPRSIFRSRSRSSASGTNVSSPTHPSLLPHYYPIKTGIFFDSPSIPLFSTGDPNVSTPAEPFPDRRPPASLFFPQMRNPNTVHYNLFSFSREEFFTPLYDPQNSKKSSPLAPSDILLLFSSLRDFVV